MKIDGKTFLVTGGAGFIGSYLVENLLKYDVKKIIIFDNFVRGKISNLDKALKDSRVIMNDIGNDITQYDILEESLKGVDGVFHFAALWLMQCHEFPETAFKVNVEGTFNIVRACIKNKVKKLVYSSSASVYGDAIKNPMDEYHPFLNKNFYGATKISSEAIITAYHHRYNLPFLGLRYMNVYGPRQDYKGAYIAVIMKMLDAIDKGESPTILGDGSEAFDFVAVEDCALANICAMKSDISDSFYNVGTGIRTSLKELAEMLVELTNCKQPINYAPRSSATLVKNRIGCPKKASKEINFSSKIKLKQGLEKLIRWRNNHKEEVNSRRSAKRVISK